MAGPKTSTYRLRDRDLKTAVKVLNYNAPPFIVYSALRELIAHAEKVEDQ